MNTNETLITIEDKGLKLLYKLAAIAAITILAFIPIQTIVFIMWPPPFNDVAAWFALFQKNKLIGLIDMDFLLAVDYVLTLIIYIAFYFNLRKTNPVWAFFALVFQLASTTIYFASTGSLEMLNLSNHYAVATDDAERTVFLASGHTMIALWQGTAFTISYLIGCIATCTISLIMLKSKDFTKVTAWLGLTAGIFMIIPPNVGLWGVAISFLSLLPTIGWLVLLAKRFLQLSRVST